MTNGTLSLGDASQVDFSCLGCTGDGTADASMTFTGTLAAINAALAGTAYHPTLNFNGSDTLTITTNDQGNTGSGGAQSDTDTVDITVNRGQRCADRGKRLRVDGRGCGADHRSTCACSVDDVETVMPTFATPSWPYRPRPRAR